MAWPLGLGCRQRCVAARVGNCKIGNCGTRVRCARSDSSLVSKRRYSIILANQELGDVSYVPKYDRTLGISNSFIALSS